MCYTESYSSQLVYGSFVIISFLPPLVLYLVITIREATSNFYKLIFLPAITLLVYYLFVVDGFVITSCTLLFASYEMPLGDLYGIVYYAPIIIATYLLYKMIKEPKYETKKVNLIIMLSGILLTFIPVALIIITFPVLLDYVESFFCKAASLIAITLTIYAMRNKNIIEDNNEWGNIKYIYRNWK